METRYDTERLNLCVCSALQAPLIAAFYKKNYDEFALYEPLFESAKSATFHKRSLAYENRLFRSNKFIRLYIFEKNNPLTIIGTVSYRDISRKNGGSCIVGYKMDRDFRRKGYCRETLLCGNSIMFEELGLSQIHATVLPDNTPSVRLLESIGFVSEGLMKEPVIVGTLPQQHLLMTLTNDR